MKHIVFLILFVFVYSSWSFAIDYTYPYLVNGAGNPNYYLSKMAFSGSGLGVFENDASYTQFRKFSFSLSQTEAFQSLKTQSMVIGFRLNKSSRLFVGASRLYQNDIPKTKIDTESFLQEFLVESSYKYQNLHAKVSYQYEPNQRMRVGAGLNYFETTIDSMKMDTFDLSGSMILLLNNVDIGISLINILGNKIGFNDSEIKETLPRSVVLNSAIKPSPWLSLNSILRYQTSTNDLKKKYLSGISLEIVPFSFFHIATGYTEQFDSLNKLRGVMSVGSSIDLDRFVIHYLFKTNDYLDNENNHLVSLSFNY